MAIKLIALDCDGTLINDNHVITDRTKNALMKAQEQGIRIALVSGRPRTGFRYETKELQLEYHHGLIGAYNGGMVIDVQTNEVKYENPIVMEEVSRFLKLIEPYDLTYIIDDGETLYTNDIENQYSIHESSAHHLKLVHSPNIADELTFSPMKILLTAPPERVDELYDTIVEICGETLGSIRSAPFYLEITVNGVNKSSALDHICEAISISKAETIAFGDNFNDLEMIRDAGIGVAMGNAVDEIKQIANIVTESNNDDGIALVLEQYLNIN